MVWQRITSVVVGLFWGAALASLLRVFLAVTWNPHLPLWVYLLVGLIGAALIGLQDWRDGHPAPRVVRDKRAEHSLCLECWNELAPQRRAVLAKVQDRTDERCCRCGLVNRDGLYAQAEQRFEFCRH
jgi:hypothetical protein